MMRARWPRLLAGLLGFTWFLEIGGGPTLNPAYTKWIGEADWMQHWLGWLLYRNAPWGFPLGKIAAVPYPVGTTVGYMDGNPLMSVLLKPFSPLLPDLFQFIGPWLAICFILQGYMGALLTSAVTDDEGQQVMGGLLFVFSPVLVARMGHDTLCAHWLLLFLLYLGLREYADAAPARRSLWLAAGAVLVAAGIHPYLTAMCWLLAQAVYVRLWRLRLVSPRRMAAAVVGTTGGVLAVFASLGYFGGEGLASSGFGDYGSDLLSLVYPAEFSHLGYYLPQLALNWEGFGFIGFGALVAAIAAIVVLAWLRPRPRAGIWVVIAAVGIMAFYSLSVYVRLNGEVVMTSRRLYSLMEPIIGPFRASGRFIWPVHYLVLIFGIWGLTRLGGPSRRSVATAVLACVVVLQATDLKVDRSWAGRKPFQRASMDVFGPAKGKYDHVALYPVEVLGACGAFFNEARVYRYMLLAYQLNATFNSGLSARVRVERLLPGCQSFEKAVEAGRLDPRTIYVVAPPKHLPVFQNAGATCGQVNGDWICVSGASDETFRALLVSAAGSPSGS